MTQDCRVLEPSVQVLDGGCPDMQTELKSDAALTSNEDLERCRQRQDQQQLEEREQQRRQVSALESHLT